MGEFLAQFAKSLPADEHAVMIWDGAGIHASKQLSAPDNVSLITLPPYSPELMKSVCAAPAAHKG